MEFQLYGRTVPAMTQISLVEGFVKLYDGEASALQARRRAVLLRAAGIVVHSTGRVSLVANAGTGRSAMVVRSGGGAAEDDDEEDKEEDKKDKEEEGRRRLQEAIDLHVAGGGSPDFGIEDIRRDAMSLYGNSPSLGEPVPLWGGLFPARDVLQDAHRTEHLAGGGRRRRRRRRLSEEMGSANESGRMVKSTEAVPSSSGTPPPGGVPAEEGSGAAQQAALNMTGTKGIEGEDVDGVGADMTYEKMKRDIQLFPFVPDDQDHSIENAATPIGKVIARREHMLEDNGKLCEFQLNLEIQETEWTIGKWRKMVKRQVREMRGLDPAHRTEKKGSTNSRVDNEDEDVPGTVERHPSAFAGKKRNRKKPRKDEAAVMSLVGSIVSTECHFYSTVNVTAIRPDWDRVATKAINYSFYMMLICLAQIGVLLRQLLHTQAQAAAVRVSVIGIGWQAVIDALVCIMHVYFSLVMPPIFTAFASVAFFKLLIFCVIEMKYMAMLMQARHTANGGVSSAADNRRRVSLIHMRFYSALMVAMVLAFYAGDAHRTVFMLLLYSFWVPQIVANIFSEARKPLHKYYICGMSITRCIAPVYMYGLPSNFWKEVQPDHQTNIVLCELLILWVGVQVAILFGQEKYGARFMIAARFLPPKYDYNRPIPPHLLPKVTDKEVEDGGKDSSSKPSEGLDHAVEVAPLSPDNMATDTTTGVTRNRIKGKGGRNEKGESMVREELVDLDAESCLALDCVICYNGIDVNKRSGYMLTPCDHIFHKDCLMQWMDVKMECPTCRARLPAL